MASYVTPDEIRQLLNVDAELLPDSLLNRYIDMAEGYVDRLTDTCWNGKTCTEEEYHDLGKFKGGVWWGIGIPVHLAKRYIKEIVSLKVFNGNEWEEWVGVRTEARNTGDYWVNYNEGKLYINAFWYYQGGREVYVKYTYGRSDLPPEVKELTLIIAMMYVLTFEKRWASIIEGTGGIGIKDMIEQLRERKQQLEDMLRAVKIPRVEFT